MPSTLHRVFCLNIRQRRKDLGLTQADVAERLQIQTPTYTQIETGRRSPTLDIVEKVCSALQISAAELLAATQPEKVAS